MIEVHLYGKLRRYADSQDPTSVSVATVEWRGGDTVGAVIARLEIPVEQVGSNVFLNGRYANSDSLIHDGDRLGLFPDDMQLLYKWYFAPHDAAGAPTKGGSAAPCNSNSEDSTGDKEYEK